MPNLLDAVGREVQKTTSSRVHYGNQPAFHPTRIIISDRSLPGRCNNREEPVLLSQTLFSLAWCFHRVCRLFFRAFLSSTFPRFLRPTLAAFSTASIRQNNDRAMLKGRKKESAASSSSLSARAQLCGERRDLRRLPQLPHTLEYLHRSPAYASVGEG